MLYNGTVLLTKLAIAPVLHKKFSKWLKMM